MHISPTGAERLKDSRSNACERTRPAAPPNSAGSPWISVHNSASRLGPSSLSTVPDGSRWMPCSGRRGVRDAELSTPSVTMSTSSSTAKIGGHDLQQVLEARGAQHRQHRLVHPALAREIAAARRDQALVLVLQPSQIVAQPLEHEMLKIEHPVAVLPGRGAQQPQRVGMAVEKIGMLAQVGDDLAGADLARPRGRAGRRRGPASAGLADGRPRLFPPRRGDGAEPKNDAVGGAVRNHSETT